MRGVILVAFHPTHQRGKRKIPNPGIFSFPSSGHTKRKRHSAEHWGREKICTAASCREIVNGDGRVIWHVEAWSSELIREAGT
jgi:hypothetical protein